MPTVRCQNKEHSAHRLVSGFQGIILVTTAASLTLGGCSTAIEAHTPIDSVNSSDSQVSEPPVTAKTASDKSAIQWASSTSDEDFWKQGRITADEVEGYSNLEKMAESATAVVLASVVSIGEGRTLTEQGVPRSTLNYPAINLRVHELLRGSLPVTSDEDGNVLLETIRGFKPGDPAPTGVTLMFLRYKGELYEKGSHDMDQPVVAGDMKAYRWVSSQGLFIQRDGKAFNPIAEHYSPDADGMKNHHDSRRPESARMIERLEKESLQDIADRVRNMPRPPTG